MSGGKLSLCLGSELEPVSSSLAHCGAANDRSFPAYGSLIKVTQNSLFSTLAVEFGHEVRNVSCGANNKSSGLLFCLFLALELQEQPRAQHRLGKEEVITAARTSVCLCPGLS